VQGILTSNEDACVERRYVRRGSVRTIHEHGGRHSPVIRHRIVFQPLREPVTGSDHPDELLRFLIALMEAGDRERVRLHRAQRREGEEHVLARSPAEGHVSSDHDTNRILVEHLDLRGRFIWRLEVAQDDIAEVPTRAVEAPDHEARPDVVFKAAGRDACSAVLLPDRSVFELTCQHL
jgi:hypothetical protein